MLTTCRLPALPGEGFPIRVFYSHGIVGFLNGDGSWRLEIDGEPRGACASTGIGGMDYLVLSEYGVERLGPNQFKCDPAFVQNRVRWHGKVAEQRADGSIGPGIDEAEHTKQRAWAANPALLDKVEKFFGDDLWHITTPAAWPKIQASGFIRPNKNARFPFSGATTARSFALQHGLVSLFDFTLPPNTSRAQRSNWWAGYFWFETRFRLGGVYLKIDRQKLTQPLIPNSEAAKPFTIPGTDRNVVLMNVKMFGCFYDGEIPTTAITGVHEFGQGIAAHLGRA